MAIQDFKDLYQWADQLSDVMAERKRDDLVKQINEAKASLASNTFTLAVLGKAKRGKSTLINALLGRKDDMLAPVDKLPASSAITRFRYNKKEQAVVVFQDNRSELIPYSRIKEFVTEESNPGNSKGVALVEVSGTFPKLPPQVELVDTPGAGSIHEHHDALLHAFIPEADAVIFIVTASMPIDQDEIDLLREVKKADINKIFFVINKIDDAEPDEIESAVQHNLQLLAQNGITPEGFHRISAKNAFLGKENSNVPALTDALGNFLAVHKGKVLRQRFLSKVNGIVESELRSIEVAYSAGSKSGTEIDADIANIQTQKQNISSKREFQEKEFQRKWNEALKEFTAKLESIERNVSASVKEKINNTWTLGVGRLVKELPTFINQTMTDTLSPITKRFEETIRLACEDLNADYPVLDNDETGKIVFISQRDITTTKGLITGGVLAVGGYGLVTAGASTAATIAATNAATLAIASSAAGTATILGTIGLGIDTICVSLFGIPIGASLMGGAGAVAAPTLLSTPIWVALSGPVGWTLAGIGVLAVPFAWRLSKLKQKDKLEEEAQKQIKEIFSGIRKDRLPAFKSMGNSILEGVRNNLDYKIKQLEDALVSAKNNRLTEAQLTILKRQSETLNSLVLQGAEWFNE
ncbi:MAG: dynamin family protein [Planctomycetaceae bacterium]|jgi:ribosome biogenesis GTPase A|nr:dynamin family protein [Planctomycetaceae bacterium]